MSDKQQTSAADEFDAAFAEASAAAPPPPAPAPAPPPSDQPADQSAQQQPGAAEKPASTGGKAAASTGESPAQTDPPAEPPTIEQLQSQLDEARHRERSSAARLSPLTRQINQLNARLAEVERERDALKAKAATAPPPPPAAPPSQAADEDENDELADAPDLRKAVQRRVEKAVAKAVQPLQQALEAANTRLAEVDGRATQAISQIGPIAEQTQEQAWAQARVRLESSFGDWRSTVGSDGFQGWLEQQPDAIQKMFPGTTFDEARRVLTLYHAETGAPIPQAKPPAASTPPAAPPVADPQQRSAAQMQRLRQAAGIAPRGAPAPRVQADPNDFEGAFAEFAAAATK